MRTTAWMIVVCLSAWLIALGGCKDKAKEISSADHLLTRQHKAWEDARQSLHSAEPNYNLVRAAGGRFRRTLRRVGKDYAGPNKEQVAAKLEELADKFDAEVAPKLTMSRPVVELMPGVTPEEVRAAFDKLDPDYRELERLTSG